MLYVYTYPKMYRLFILKSIGKYNSLIPKVASIHFLGGPFSGKTVSISMEAAVSIFLAQSTGQTPRKSNDLEH